MKSLVEENIWDGCYNVFFFKKNVDEADKITTVLMLVKNGLLLYASPFPPQKKVTITRVINSKFRDFFLKCRLINSKF